MDSSVGKASVGGQQGGKQPVLLKAQPEEPLCGHGGQQLQHPDPHFVVHRFVPETKGRTLEEIESSWRA